MSRDTGVSDRLNRPPADFVSLLAAGENYAKIGEKYGITRNTVRAWAALPEIVADLAEIHADAMAATKRKINCTLDKATATLIDVMDNGDSSSARVSAARVLMDRILPTLTATEMSGSLGVSDIRQLSDDALIAERDALIAKLSPVEGA